MKREDPGSKTEPGAPGTRRSRIIMEDRFYWLTMKLLSKIIGPFEGMEPGKRLIQRSTLGA